MAGRIAGIDVHKRVLMVVVGRVSQGGQELTGLVQRKFGTTSSELLHLQAWLRERGAPEAVMESTAQD